jgi:choline monooxygenase
LRASPHFGGMNNHKPSGFIPSNNGLEPVRIKVWHDWIFVNLSKKAPPFEKYAATLIKQLEGVNLEKVYPVATLEFGEIFTNWKFLIENFIEPYHVQFVHKKTTSQPLKDHYTIVDGMCYGSGVNLSKEDASSGNLSVSSRYLSLFPNFIVGTYFPGQLGVYLNQPIGSGRTNQKRIIYTTDGHDLTKAEIENQKNLWWKVHKEDHEICERLQLGRASPVSIQGGLLSPHWEKSVRAFQKIVVKSVMKYSKVK